MAFIDRTDAGRQLAARLVELRDEDVVVVGLPRGGVPVAAIVAEAIDAPLDVIVVRKLGVPFQPELAMGAVGEGGARVVSRSIVRLAEVSDEELAAIEARERAEVERRADRYREGRARVPLAGRTIVVVDDGIATGATARAACAVARVEGARRVVLAVPVGAPDAIESLADAADEIVCLETPEWFSAVGQWYADFTQVSDEEVVDLLERAAGRLVRVPAAATSAADYDRDVDVLAGTVRLAGHLTVPAEARGLVIVAHGSGSSRHSPRNRFVAGVLNDQGLATLLFDLLTTDEELRRENVFDVSLLSGRLAQVTRWAASQPGVRRLPIGYFGASTGAAAALAASVEEGVEVAAIVSRGGRPDLAADRLLEVRSPTLFIVGDRDEVVLELNQAAQRLLTCESHLALVHGATHLFEEPGTLATAAKLAGDWFLDHLAPAEAASSPRGA